MYRKISATAPVAFASVALLCVFSTAPAGQALDDERPMSTVQAVVDDLRARLSIPHAVTVSPVASNARVMSVAPPPEVGRPFELTVEDRFLRELSDDELRAALAHELGHVWVFTHHPYLQTERLANEIAMQVVSRESLERVYVKVWARGGLKGDLVAFLGPPPDAPLLHADAVGH